MLMTGSLDSSETSRTATRSDNGNRVRPATVLYRVLMEVLEARRVELNLSMAVVDDMAGLQDGFFSKMTKPDALNGRQSRWETVELVVQALFGDDFNISITSGVRESRVLKSSLCFPKHPSANAPKNKHWRHRKFFVELGKRGGAVIKQKYKTMSDAEKKRIVAKARKTRRQNRLARAQAGKIRAALNGATTGAPAE
jgi:hypothetical protein